MLHPSLTERGMRASKSRKGSREPQDKPMDQHADNAQRAKAEAEHRYPFEIWRELEEGIFIAGSREPRSNNQEKILEKELAQARILAAQGSVIYLLPEIVDPDLSGVKHPDAVVNGFIMEFKTITGGIRQIEEHFRKSRLKAENVYFKIDSALTRREVARKLSGVIKEKGYQSGIIIAYFTDIQSLVYWNVTDLR